MQHHSLLRDRNMFYNTEKSRKLQRSSELGLYRYNDSDNDRYNQPTCRYVIVLLITIIVVSLICLITYSYVSESDRVILQPANNLSNTEIEPSYVQVANMSYSKAIINEPMDETISESAVTDDDETKIEPVALEFHHEVSNNHRRQLKTPPRPFIYENRDPIPIGFLTPAGQINNHAYPQTPRRNKAKNIQEIIQYLTDHQTINESSESGEKRSKKRQRANDNRNSKRAKGTSNIFTYTADPFFPYKPQNPSDVNLLATNGFRFAPTVQVEPKKPKKSVKQPEIAVPNRHAENAPVNVNFDSYPAGNDEKKVRKRKNRYPRPPPPPQYGNYGYGPGHLYSENNFYNQGESEPANRLNYGNRFRNNAAEYNRNKIRNDLLHDSEANKPRQIMVHLNLYPKRKRHNGEHRNIELLREEVQENNCTDDSLEEPSSDLAQIKNATEFNQLMQNIKFSYVNHKDEREDQNDEEVVQNNNSGDDVFQIKDTVLKLNEPDEFQHVSNHNPEHIEVLKSIGFTVLNSNFTTPNANTAQYAHNQDHWYPMRINNGGYLNDQLADMSSNTEHVTEMYDGPELNINFDTNDETVTLPLPRDIFEKYFNKKPPVKSNIDWDDDMLMANPNLINHKSHFNDQSR